MAGHKDVKSLLLGQEVATKAAMPTSARSVGVEVDKLLRPLHSKAGGKTRGRRFVPPELLSAWPEIVGPRLAGACLPVNLKQQPKRSKAAARHRPNESDGALLEVLCASEVMVDVDYGQALLIERINTFFGYQAVSRLKVVMKPVTSGKDIPTTPIKPSDQSSSRLDPATREKIEDVARDIEDPALRDALSKLGNAILSKSQGS